MSKAHLRWILMLVVLVITFYLPGTLAIAASDDPANNNSNGHGQGQDGGADLDNGYGNDGQTNQQGNANNSENGKSNGHGQGQDSPADHDNGYGNDDPPVADEEPNPTDTSDDSDAQEPVLLDPVSDPAPDATDNPVGPNAHGQGQDSPADHDNGYGNDPTPPNDPPVADEEPNPTDSPNDSDPQVPVLPTPVPEADPQPEPTDTPQDPSAHGEGQDSPADHDNGYGNDDPLLVDEEPSPIDTADESESQNPVLPIPIPDLESMDPPGVDEPGQGAEPSAGSSASQPPQELTPVNSAPDTPPRVSASVKEPPPTESDQNDAEPAPSGNDAQTSQGDLLNEPPVATPGQTVVFAGSTATIDLSTFVVDGNGDELELSSLSLPDHGTLTVTNGVALFTPEPGFFGVETLRFTACDPSGACIDTTVSVYVPPVNDILIATNDTGILSRFIIGADQGLSQQELVADLLTDSATRLAVPMAGAVSVIGGSLLFGLHKIGTRFDLLRLLFRRN